jgi:hypothetical protein
VPTYSLALFAAVVSLWIDPPDYFILLGVEARKLLIRIDLRKKMESSGESLTSEHRPLSCAGVTYTQAFLCSRVRGGSHVLCQPLAASWANQSTSTNS